MCVLDNTGSLDSGGVGHWGIGLNCGCGMKLMWVRGLYFENYLVRRLPDGQHFCIAFLVLSKCSDPRGVRPMTPMGRHCYCPDVIDDT